MRRFGANGIRRLLVCNATTVLTVAAAQVPDFTVAIVVVNSTIYGGSGGSVGTYSLAGGATEIAIHEMGHTAFGLADEYAYYAGGAETGHDHHPRGRTGTTERHAEHQSGDAEVGLGRRRDYGASHDGQSKLRAGGWPRQYCTGWNGRRLRRGALLSLRRLPA